MDLGNQYLYFQDEIYNRFTEPLFDELYMIISVEADQGNKKTTRRSIAGIFLVVGENTTSWFSRRQTSVQKSKFGAEFTAIKIM